jgi:DNA-binding XRE family transcriptional regulator
MTREFDIIRVARGCRHGARAFLSKTDFSAEAAALVRAVAEGELARRRLRKHHLTALRVRLLRMDRLTLGARLGVSERLLGQLEHGKQRPTAAWCVGVARVIDEHAAIAAKETA